MAGDRVVFLDVAGDRYFRLPDSLETAFLDEVSGDGARDHQALQRLLELRVLIATSSTATDSEIRELVAAGGSAIESEPPAHRVTSGSRLEIFSMVIRTQIGLKTRRFRDVLASAAAERDRSCSDDRWRGSDEDGIREAAAAFAAARPMVPLATCCLLDSLSLLRFLARRRLFAELVIGVTGEPFAAHCWVQAGDLVLNDTLGHVTAHTRIRVI